MLGLSGLDRGCASTVRTTCISLTATWPHPINRHVQLSCRHASTGRRPVTDRRREHRRGSSQEKTPFTIDTMWAIQRVGTPAVSPDGPQVAYTVTTYDVEENRGNADIWIVPTAGGTPRRVTTNPASDSGPVWSPDGTRLAFVSRREADKAAQIYVIDVRRRRGRADHRDAAGRRQREVAARRHAPGVCVARHCRPRVARGHDQGARGAREEQGQGARHRKSRLPLLGSLAHRRGVPAPVRRRHRDEEGDRPAAGLAAPVRPAGRQRRLRHLARRRDHRLLGAGLARAVPIAELRPVQRPDGGRGREEPHSPTTPRRTPGRYSAPTARASRTAAR